MNYEDRILGINIEIPIGLCAFFKRSAKDRTSGLGQKREQPNKFQTCESICCSKWHIMGIRNYSSSAIRPRINDTRSRGGSVRCKKKRNLFEISWRQLWPERIELGGPISSARPYKGIDVNTSHIDDPLHRMYNREEVHAWKLFSTKFSLIYEDNLVYLTDIFWPNLEQKGLFGN